MHYAKTAHRLREHIIKFSGELSAGLPKVACRFITEAIYGIQARQSVRLTEIARSLGEEISIKKTQYRLVLRDAETGIEQQSIQVVIDRAFTDDF